MRSTNRSSPCRFLGVPAGLLLAAALLAAPLATAAPASGADAGPGWLPATLHAVAALLGVNPEPSASHAAAPLRATGSPGPDGEEPSSPTAEPDDGGSGLGSVRAELGPEADPDG